MLSGDSMRGLNTDRLLLAGGVAASDAVAY
jgi:hypothetical protein